MAQPIQMLVTSPFLQDPVKLAELEQQHGMKFVVPGDGQSTTDLIGEADAAYGWLTADEFAAQKKLRWVQSASAGVEWIWRVPGLAESDIVITNMRGAHAVTIAEHTFAMLLVQTRGLLGFQKFQHDHDWNRTGIEQTNLAGLTMGIVGFGNIGRAIAHRATGFEMRVLAVDAEPGAPGEGVAEVWPLDRLDDMLAESDVLVIAAPWTPSSRDMIRGEHIRRMRRGSYIFQMSRGSIVNEAALVDALEEGHIAGGGLDVTETEPLPVGDPLWTAPNLIVTPHSSAVSPLTTANVWQILDENLKRFTRGEELMNLVDKHRGW
jgi:phosphoglycerate dehydrogenase-like enzyme